MNREIKQELDRLRAASKTRLLDPRAVIEAARDRNSPLHTCFTWDQKKAFEANLLSEARRLIARYSIVYTRNSSDPISVRHFVSLTSDRVGGGGYREISEVVGDQALYEELLADAMNELQRLQAKYHHLQELAGVFEAIEAVARKRPARQQHARRAA